MDFKKKAGACEVYTLQGEKEEWMTLRNLLAYARDCGRLLSSTEARMSRELQSEIYAKLFEVKE